MFKRRVNLSYLLVVLFMAFFLSACNDNNKKSFLSVETSASETVLEKIEITPTDLTVKQHSQQQFTAKGIYSDKTVRDLTKDVQWNSTEQILSFDNNGLATAAHVGNTVITASYQSIVSNESRVVVEAELPSLEVVLEKITITPTSVNLEYNATYQFVAMGHYSDGSTADISSQVQWQSTDNKLSFSATGLATALVAGETSVTASYRSISSRPAQVVVATLSSIVITPASATLNHNATQQFVATGIYSDKTTADISSQVQWQSTDNKLSFNETGLATALQVGDTRVTASHQSITSNSSQVKVVATLSSIAITPTSLNLDHNATQQFVAMGIYSDETTADISGQVQWHSTDNKLSFNETGLATALQVGDTSVTASYESLTSNESLVKVVAVLTSIKIFPEELTTIQSETHQFTARGDYSDGSTMDLTEVVSWADSDEFVVFDENSKGLARFDQYGSTRVTANYESITSDVSYVDIDQMFSFTNSAANLISLNQQKYETLPTITLTKQSETVNEKTNFKFTDVMIREVTEQTITITNKTPQTVDKLFISYLKYGEKKYQVITLDSPLSPYATGTFSNEIIDGESLTIIHPMSLFLPSTIFTHGDSVEFCQTVTYSCFTLPTPSQRVIFEVYATTMHNLLNQAEYPLLSKAFFATDCVKYAECAGFTSDLAYPLYRYYQYGVEGQNLSFQSLYINPYSYEGMGGGNQPQLTDGYSTQYGVLSIWEGYISEGPSYNPYSANRFKTMHHETAHAYGLSHASGITYGLSELVAYYLIDVTDKFVPYDERSAVKDRKLPAILGVIDSKEENTVHIKLFNNPNIAVEGQLAVAIDSPYNITGKASYNVATNMLTVKLTEKPQSIVYIRLYDSVTRSYQTTIRIKKEEWL